MGINIINRRTLEMISPSMMRSLNTLLIVLKLQRFVKSLLNDDATDLSRNCVDF